MRGRPLYLTILGGAVVLAFLLRSLPFGLVIVLALVAVAIASVRYRRVAKPEKEAVAALGLGFERSPTGACALAPSPTEALSLVVEPKTFLIPEPDRRRCRSWRSGTTRASWTASMSARTIRREWPRCSGRALGTGPPGGWARLVAPTASPAA